MAEKKEEKEEEEEGCPVGTLKEIEEWEQLERKWDEEVNE